MAFSYGWRGPNIVKDGLILYLDAGSPNSFYSPTAGTTWKDISGNGNNGTLTNGPTFNSGNGGSIVFDGVNDYVTCGNPSILQSTVGSVNVWFKGNQQGNDYNGIVVKPNSWGIFIFQSTLRIYDWGNNTGRNTNINVSDNIWRNVCLTFTETVGTPSNNANIYINGSLILTTTLKYSSNSSPVLLGWGNFGSQYLMGSIGLTTIYNRVLSATEIQQNFNTTKTRFGL